MKVWLDYINAAVVNHPAEATLTVFLLTTGNRYCQSIGHPLRVFQVIERTRLLEIDRIDIFQHPSDLDGFRRVIGAIGISVDSDLIAQRFAGKRN